MESKYNKQISFGKYKGKKISEIKAVDASYLKWLVKQENMSEGLQFCLGKILMDDSFPAGKKFDKPTKEPTKTFKPPIFSDDSE